MILCYPARVKGIYVYNSHYLEWWLKCPNCLTIYAVESGKRWFDGKPPLPISHIFIARSNGQAAVESGMRKLLGKEEPFVHGPALDAHGDDLVPPWIDYPDRTAWLVEHYPGETL